jgi:ubiquinone/menaquinone biosynthesis C-methylase UbiE
VSRKEATIVANESGTPDRRRERYTLGYGNAAMAMMASRTATSHAGFFLPHLRPGMRLLDCGCDPGTITIGLAEAVRPGDVLGLDVEANQVQFATDRAKAQGVSNVRFEVGDIYELPAEDASFDGIFIEAVLMNLREPLRGLHEAYRVLKPGGVIGVREVDHAGDLRFPHDPAIEQGIALYIRARQHNGHDPYVGRKLRSLLHEANFAPIHASASFESSGTPEAVQAASQIYGGLMTQSNITDQILEHGWADRPTLDQIGVAWREFGAHSGAFMTLTWCEAVGWKA